MRRDGWALAFAMTFPTIAVAVYFLSPSNGSGANPVQQIAYVLGKLVQFCFPVLYLWWANGCWPRPDRPNFAGLTIGLTFGLVTATGMLWLYFVWLKGMPLLSATPDSIRAKLAEFGVQTLVGYVLLGLFIAVLHSILEEYYWRWFVFGRLRCHLSFVPAVLLAAVAFMGHHVVVLYVYLPGFFWTAVVPLSLCVGFGGVVWAWLYERTGTIWSAWLSHLIIDAAIMVIGYDLLQGRF